MIHFPEKLFIAGADANVGKTLVSAILTLGLKGRYWKPIQCGVSPCTDTQWVHEATGLAHSHFLKESYIFGESLPPHMQHTGIDMNTLISHQNYKPNSHLIVEGTGGIMLPLNEKELLLDFIKAFQAPTLLVIRNNKGAISQALLTLEKLQREEIPIFGILLNGDKDPNNKKTIEEYAKNYPVFELGYLKQITPQTLTSTFESTFCNTSKGLALVAS